MDEDRGQLEGTVTVGDLISISRAPPVVSLSEVEKLRDALRAGEAPTETLDDLLGGYHLGDPDTKAALDALLRSLARAEPRGDAFLVQGVYGSGKSHLLAVLALLCGHPGETWPVFLRSHTEYQRTSASLTRPKLVVAIPLDEYPSHTHPLERIVLSALEDELARRHGVRVALTEESHLLDLVDRYVLPQAAAELQARAQAETGTPWDSLRADSPGEAAQIALAFIEQSGFPLDWRRSRAEAWGMLRRTLDAHGLDGPVVLLDELGMFLAAKDRRSLNADASFLQYLAQRTAAERCWLVCVTQRGLEDAGDVDRRTLRQLRDRFRPALTLDLAELGWIVERRLVRRRDERGLRKVADRLCDEMASDGLTAEEVFRSYPINPLCLRALQGAAESQLSRTRSVLTVLQEAAHQRGWLQLPAERLITPDVVFDLARDEMGYGAAGQRHLHAYEEVEANAERILPGREEQLRAVMKTLVLLGLAGVRWTTEEIRDSSVGGEEQALWRDRDALQEALQALYRWGAHVERTRAEDGEGWRYFLQLAFDHSVQIRQRINELVAEFEEDDTRAAQAGLSACQEAAFPLAGLGEPRLLAVDWWNARRYVSVTCRHLGELKPAEVQNLLGALESPETREDGRLYLALPSTRSEPQEAAWHELSSSPSSRYSAGVLAWLPRPLTGDEWGLLAEHAALARIVEDRTFAARREAELRRKLNERWAESQALAREIVQRAYYLGKIADLKGALAVEPERLAGMVGRWEETLAAAFSGGFRALFPKFPSVAPERKLAGRAQTNQIIDQFIRPGRVSLPPASALEAHIGAFAAPLGLVEGERGELRLALKNRELVAAAIATAPSLCEREEVAPEHAIPFGELAGRLAKSEWGLTREQNELLVAALIRTGHLVGLDAFLRPTRLDAIAAPLAENLPYVMRGRALTARAAQGARALWSAATGGPEAEWDLPAQERAWGEMIAWAHRLTSAAAERRAAVARAAEAFGHPPESWAFARAALATAEVVAGAVEASRTSREGFGKVLEAAARLAEGREGAARGLSCWRRCELFLDTGLASSSEAYRLLSDARVACPEGSLLARRRAEALAAFSSAERLVSHPESVSSLAQNWLEAYRKHYLAWHGRVHAPGRFDPLSRLRRSELADTLRRLGAAGLRADEANLLDARLAGALARRCLAADPLPGGRVVCLSCGIGLGQELSLPEAEEMEGCAEDLLAAQIAELREHEGLLRRRLEGCGEQGVRDTVGKVLEAVAGGKAPRPGLLPYDDLADEAVAWIRQQLGQPKAKRRAVADLERALRGKEMSKRQVVGKVEEWLATTGDDEVVEIV